MNLLDQTFVRSKNTAFENAAGETLILDLDSGSYFGVGEVGGFVWERLDGSRSLAAIADELLEVYEVELEVVRVDLLALIENLSEKGLVRLSDLGE